MPYALPAIGDGVWNAGFGFAQAKASPACANYYVMNITTSTYLRPASKTIYDAGLSYISTHLDRMI
ncbi:MAG: hypothetical protein K2K23_06725 [Muribaculaceae bacterium]|nr:hypothetical protein [Muribaculaceae bacterium]